MITSIPSRLPVLRIPPILSWINLSSAFILLGLYHGLLATLPIGPPQLLSIRALLLGGNLGGVVAISGSIVGQLMIVLSIYCSPLYVLLARPHVFALLVLPYTFTYWYRIKDLLNYQSLRPIASLRDTRIYELFFDSIILQLLNPILLPNPALARLLNLLFFRYSCNVLFITSTILGWFSGQYLFINLSKLLLFRIESDSPILYLLVKRIIHRTFSIIMLSFSLLHLGRAPIPFVTKKIIDNLQFTASKREEFPSLKKLWPSVFFDYRQWKRPLRYVGNSRFSTRSPMKKKVSQYFFDTCLSDGKQRLSFTYLPSLAILGKNLGKYFNRLEFSPSAESFKEWIDIGKERTERICNEFQHRVEFLDHGFATKEITEKKSGLSNSEGRIFNKIYDPLLSKQSGRMVMISKSPWLLTEKFSKSKRRYKSQHLLTRNNKLKDWISNQWQELGYGNSVLPWEPLTRDARHILSLLINKSKKVGFDTNFKRVLSLDGGDAVIDSNERTTSTIGDTRKRMNRKSNLNWELVFNFSPRQRILYFNHMQLNEWDTLKNTWKKLFVGNTTQVGNTSLSTGTSEISRKFQEINKELPRWTSDLKNDKFDVIAIGVTDIRQRRVKNLGYLMKGKDKRRKIVRRFSQQSDFRRKLVKGAMRARRRKTLVWKMLQLETNSPFFLRVDEKLTPTKTSISKINVPRIARSISISGKGKKNYFNEKTLSFRRTRADRLSIANRWDFPLAQWGRSWLLIIQSHLRKYFVLPILVILKNVSRLLFFQNPEWNEDWVEWNREIHIRCTYDGTEVSERELPEQWLRDGLQIKVIYPFYLKPWHSSKYRNQNLGINEKYSEQFVSGGKLHYCYLTAWGFLTDLPFGNAKKQPSFWKPINRELREKWVKKISFRFLSVGVKSYGNDVLISQKSDTCIEKSLESNWYDSDTNAEYRKTGDRNNYRIVESSIMNDENVVSEMSKELEHKTLIHIQELENSIAKKSGKKIFNNNRDVDSSFDIVDIEGEKLESAKELIKIELILIRFYERNIESIRRWFSFSGVNIKKIEMDFQVKMEILKESIKNIFDNHY